MKDEMLMKLSLIISIIGVIALFIFVQFTEPIKVSVSRIDDSMLGQNIEVTGQIESFSAKDGNIFFILNDNTGKIKVVMFERDARRTDGAYILAEQSNVSVIGKISLYKSEFEVIASTIKVL